MRKSIFDIASEAINISNEVDRIVQLSLKEGSVYFLQPYTLFNYVDRHCFSKWKHRGHFIDLKDLLEAINYNSLKKQAKSGDVDSFITLVELTYNIWALAYKDVKKRNSSCRGEDGFYHLEKVMLDNLDKYNHKFFSCDDRFLVIEDKPEVTAVAEIVQQPLALDIIKYNHRSLQGEIEIKKAILITMGTELEPRRGELERLNKQLASDIFFMLNNVNVRHNNCVPTDSKYKEFVANMKPKQIEEWYDELYQMILLAFLLLDNEGRSIKVGQLKTDIVGGL